MTKLWAEDPKPTKSLYHIGYLKGKPLYIQTSDRQFVGVARKVIKDKLK